MAEPETIRVPARMIQTVNKVLADLSTICVTIALRLEILRLRPSVVTLTVSLSASATAVAGPALLEAGVQRPARAHLVIAPAVRHAPPSVGSRNDLEVEFVAHAC